MSKIGVKIENETLVVGLDSNADGENSITVKVNLSEAIKEMLAKGQAIEGNAKFAFKLEGTSFVLRIDTDQDGKELASLTLDLIESYDEVMAAVKK